MTGWIIFTGIAGIFLFLLMSRIRVEFSYGKIIRLTARFLFLQFSLLPTDKETKKQRTASKKSSHKKKKKPVQSERTQEERKISKTVDAAFDELIEKISNWMAVLRSILYGVNLLLRHITIDRVVCSLHIGGEDPAQAGIAYGKTCILMYSGLAVLQNYLRMKIQKLELIPEMMEDVFTVQFSLRVCIPVYVVLWAAGGALWKLLIRMIKKQMAETKQTPNRTEGGI